MDTAAILQKQVVSGIEGIVAVQTRLPGALATQLQSIVAEYESDMALLRAENSDSETLSLDLPDTIQCPLVFPSGQLLEVLADAVKVGQLILCLKDPEAVRQKNKILLDSDIILRTLLFWQLQKASCTQCVRCLKV